MKIGNDREIWKRRNYEKKKEAELEFDKKIGRGILSS